MATVMNNIKQHWIGYIAIALTFCVIVLIPSLSPAAPTIAWNPESIEETISPGESKTITVSFTSSKDVENAEIRIVPELEPYIQTQPASFSKISKGQTVNIDITISANQEAELGSFEGCVQIKAKYKNKKTYAKPLPMVVNIGQLFQDEEYNYQVRHNSVFEISEFQNIRPGFIQGKLFTIPNDMPNLSISVYENPSLLPMESWYATMLMDREYAFSDSSSRIITQVLVNGIQSLQVRSNLLGYIKLRTFIPYEDKIFGLETTVPDDVDVPESYFLMLETFSFTE
jgi:hypothetical protein